MKINEEIIKMVLEPYNVKVLQSAELDYPVIKGRFFIGNTYYHNPPLSHATDIEIQLCLNQLGYAGIAQLMHDNSIPEIKNLDFQKMREESMLIIESKKRFRRPISTNEEIYGEMARWYALWYPGPTIKRIVQEMSV